MSLNRWLTEQGYQVERAGVPQGRERESHEFGELPDWRKTRAYVYSTSGIRINLKGRDQFGIVRPGREYEELLEEITRKLMDMTDEEGHKVMKAVYRVDELYGASDLQEAPDLLFEFRDDRFHTTYYAIISRLLQSLAFRGKGLNNRLVIVESWRCSRVNIHLA